MSADAEGTTKKPAGKPDGEADVVAAIAAMSGSDREIAARLHSIITATAPSLTPKLWYGMPAWAKDGKVVCFFQASQKFKTRYATFGFQHDAHLDDGNMWPVAFALTELGDAEEVKIGELVRKAVG